jgi:hypothetical protein
MDSIVKTLRVFKDCLPSLRTRLKAEAINAFPFECSDEGLAQSIVITIPPT